MVKMGYFLFTAACMALMSCASQNGGTKQVEDGSAAAISAPEQSDDMYDPIEPVNRGIFWFNDKFDRYLLGPVAQGYDYVMPEFVKEGVGNFFSNLKYPVDLVADIIELDFSQAASDTGRFAVNTTIGVAGLIDAATPMGLEKNKGDIGIALGRDGIPAGPYIVIPFLGPSNLRDAIGLGAGAFASPTAIMSYSGVDYWTTFWISVGTYGLEFVDTRAKMEDAIKTARESSVDYYLFMQSAYMQYRNGLIRKDTKSEKDILNEGPKNPETEAAEARALLDDDAEK